MNSTGKWLVISALLLGAFTVVSPDAQAAVPTLRSSAMGSANTQKGAKYVWGAEGGYSRGYDCSGLVYWAYKKHGRILPRTAAEQYKKSTKIAYKNRRPGDLIFIRDARGHVYHVGIYIGMRNGRSWILNASTGSYRGRKVVEAPVYEYTSGSPTAVVGRF